MKFFPKRFENYYDIEKTTYDPSRIEPQGMDYTTYVKRIKDVHREFEKVCFDTLVKHSWLMSKFAYKGVVKGKFNGHQFDMAYGTFLRGDCGYSGYFIRRTRYFNAIRSYFKDFFPNFADEDPFIKKYEYPYKYMTFDHLLLVYEMKEDRMGLLQYGEDHKMDYVPFVNYVLNHISCLNEEDGNLVYEFVTNCSSAGGMTIVVREKK